MIRSEREVERLVRDYQKLVVFVVHRYLQRYFVDDMEREDLVSWGMIGLLQAARAWDPERSRSFSTLACKAIERMIVRGVRREWKPERAAVTVSLDELTFGGEGDGREERYVDRIADNQDLERQFLDAETRRVVQSAVQQLSAPDRRLIERRFYEETPMVDIARELGLTRQGVYQREKRVLRQLHAALSPSFAGE